MKAGAPNGINMIGLGTDLAQIAAMRTGQVVGMPNDIGVATKLEDEGVARIVVRFGEIVPTFIMHVIFATNETRSRSGRTTCGNFSPAGSRPSVSCARNKAEVVRIGSPSDACKAGDREPRLRRGHADVLRNRPFRSEGHRESWQNPSSS